VEDCTDGINLNLGCGKVRWEGWVNIDFEAGDRHMDLRHLAYADHTVDTIAAIHVIEHFYRWEVPELLGEWLRVLKPGGKLILELPCMNKVIAYLCSAMKRKEPLSFGMTWHALWGDPKYEEPLMVHKWGYTQEMLEALVKEVGFVDLQFPEPRYHFPVRDMRMEAIKPC
jgi:predicted SAM-dependent methyltransferase